MYLDYTHTHDTYTRTIIKRKLHFITINYALDYTLHHKLSNYTLCTLNYYTITLCTPVLYLLLYLTKSY